MQSRVIIYVNVGSGKTTLARGLGLPVLSLDHIAWAASAVGAPIEQSLAALDAFMSEHTERVIEGCYGDLIKHAAKHATELRFLNPGAETCIANARNRPWESGYCESAEEQQRLLEPLIEFIRLYEKRSDEFGLACHRSIFAAFTGPKCEHDSQS